MVAINDPNYLKYMMSFDTNGAGTGTVQRAMRTFDRSILVPEKIQAQTSTSEGRGRSQKTCRPNQFSSAADPGRIN